MTEFRINLIRPLVPPRKRRMRFFLVILSYVAVLGGLLAAVAWHYTAKFVDLHARRAALSVQEKWFRQKYPDVNRFDEYAQDLRMGLDHCDGLLQGIQAVAALRMDLPPILLALLEPMTEGMRMNSFIADRTKKALSFEISIPATTFDRRKPGEADVISSWNDHPVLKARLRSIVLIGSRRARGPTGFEYVLTFSGAFKDASGAPES